MLSFNNKITNKHFCWIFLVSVFIILVVIILLNFVIDPFFLYRRPKNGMYYALDNQRYQNNGILKNFDYDAIITGTSMTENFLVSELNSLFNVNSIKVSNSGGSFKEMSDRLHTAFKHKTDVKMVVWGLDYRMLIVDKDYMFYFKETYPAYLYDDNFWNDYKYLLNLDVLASSICNINNTFLGIKPTSFDEYSYWGDKYIFGKNEVNKIYKRKKSIDATVPYTLEDKEIVKANIDQNIIKIIKENSDTQFYLFFTPYSIYWFDNIYRKGKLQRQLSAERTVIEMLLNYNNVHLFSFFDDFELTTNLDNYKDTTHYGPNINSEILKSMANGNHQLTEENYESYLKTISDFYLSYNYDSLFADVD